MGNFLAAPITEKVTETGSGNDLSYGISAMQGWRTSMEDAHVAVFDFAAEGSPANHMPKDYSLFAVCDGHGGSHAAEMACEILAEVFAATAESHQLFKDGKTPTPEEIGKALRDAYLDLDQRIKRSEQVQQGMDQSGCTAISAVVTPTHIIVANAGDSRGVLAKNGKTEPMSYDHKPMNDTERQRIEKAGGLVRGNRVNGDLAVSRALGDFTYKQSDELKDEEQQVSAEPEVKIEKRDGSEEFLVLACDGIWDVMSNDDVNAHVRDLMQKGENDMGLIAEDVMDVCLRLGSRDNMSVVLIKFPAAKIGSGEGVAGIRREREKEEEEARKHDDSPNTPKDIIESLPAAKTDGSA